MIQHVPEKRSTGLINWKLAAIMGNMMPPPEILMKRTRPKTKKTNRTVPMNRRSCASRTRTALRRMIRKPNPNAESPLLVSRRAHKYHIGHQNRGANMLYQDLNRPSSSPTRARAG
jgi:hypothetical protein